MAKKDNNKKRDLQGVPDGAETIKVGNRVFLSYTIDMPGKKVPIRMAWEINASDAQRIFGKDLDKVKIDRDISEKKFKGLGVFVAGHTEQLSDLGSHPWQTLREEYRKEIKLRPWLANREFLRLTLEAYAEGRQPTETEIQSTKWWQSKTESEREWIELVNRSPKEANQLLKDNEIYIQRLIKENGISHLSQRAIDFMTRKYTHGRWSKAELETQVLNLADPRHAGKLYKRLSKITGGPQVRSQEYVSEVQQLANEYLGPNFGGWSRERINRWASILRTDTVNGRERLLSHLRNQFNSLYGDVYTDPELTYQDIAEPWRGFARNILGREIDETDPMFNQILKANDSVFAHEQLVNYGIKNRVKKVENDILGALIEGVGGQVTGLGVPS